jgi:polyphosphate kinase
MGGVTEAKTSMFFRTDTADAPWTVIKSDDKKHARLNAIPHLLVGLPYPGKDARIARPPDPLIIGAAAEVLSNG